MKRYPIAPKGPEVSAVSYGFWHLRDDDEGFDTPRIRAKIDACLEAGITTFDHADIYGGYTCEGLFGKVLAEAPELRDQMEIVTKCGIRVGGEHLPEVKGRYYEATSERIRACVDRSLKELNTDRIDVLLVHRPDWLTSAEDTAAGLQQVMDAGKVRSVGVSNYSVHQSALLQHYLGSAPVTNQLQLNLLKMDPIYDGTLDQCQAAGAHPMIWSPIASGRIFSGKDEDAIRLHNALKEIAPEYNAEPDQIALAWVMMLPSQPQPVLGTNRIERIQKGAAAADITLSRAHWYQLWEAAKGHRIP